MAKNFETKNNKNEKDRSDIYESNFETPLKKSDTSSNSIIRNIHKWVEFCAFLRWMPDIFYDMLKPATGGIKLDLYQRVMMRVLSRFVQNYFCLPRGGSKTLTEIMVLYHTAVCFPNIKLTLTASTKESAVKIWKEKHDEIIRFYPAMFSEIKSAQFSKDSGRVEFQNGAVIDNLANAQSSKGLRRNRGSLEESALIDKDTYDDAIEPIFNIGRVTMTGESDPTELNGAINRFSTSGYKNSDEYEKILKMTKEMTDLKGSFVFGSDWMIPVHFGRQKISVINKARSGSIIRFRQNYLCLWIGVGSGALLNISKMIKAREIPLPELECPRDKKGGYELNEYIFGIDVARSAADSNNKTAIVVAKIIRNHDGVIRQVQLVNIVSPPNGLNFKEQSIIIKRLYKKYGGNHDINKSRVKAVVIDANTIGQGLVEKLLEDVTDPETLEELGCWATINTDDKAEVSDAPNVLYCLKSQGINGAIIRIFLDYVESDKLKLLKPHEVNENVQNDPEESKLMLACAQTQLLIDEVANLRLKKTETTITVEQVVKRVDKDRYSATAYLLYYIALFLEKEEEENDDDYDFFMSSGFN